MHDICSVYFLETDAGLIERRNVVVFGGLATVLVRMQGFLVDVELFGVMARFG